MKFQIAVDIGGTQLRAACYSVGENRPRCIERIPTVHPSNSPYNRLEQLIQSVWPEDGAVESIAVAAPGPLDPYKGIIFEAPNIPDWVDLPLRSLLENRFQVPVALGNDANLAALGEWMFGAGRGHHHLVYLTISTGIGGGVIIDDRLLLGKHGLGAELGHVTVIPDGPLCGCGQRGHLEAISSGTGISNWVREQLNNGTASILENAVDVNAKIIADAARSGDPLSIAAFQRAGTYLGLAVTNFLHIFNPTIIVMGGGVSRSWDLFIETVRSTIHLNVMNPHFLSDLTITRAELSDDAGLMGALALARSQNESRR
jgi:glucokinase